MLFRSGTGYLSKKFIDPNIRFSASGTRSHTPSRRPFIRMAELYLNLAECYAALDDTPNAIENLNIIRERAGVRDLTTPDIKVITGIRRSGKSVLLQEFVTYLQSLEEPINIVMINLQELEFDYLLEYHALHKYILDQYKEGMTNVLLIDEIGRAHV